MRSIAFSVFGPRLAALCVVFTTGCGLSDGEKGSLRRLFGGELPDVKANNDDRKRDAGRTDTRTTDDDTTDRDKTTDDDTDDDTDDSATNDDADDSASNDSDAVGPTGVNPTGVNPTDVNPNTTSSDSDDSDVSPSTGSNCDDDTSGLTLGDACTVGVGECERTGEVVCRAAGLTCSVSAGRPRTEQCNGIDDDCDGEVDEVTSGVCRLGEGGCEREGTWVCVDAEFVCDAEVVEPQEELCNGLDDDCDGNIDEGFGLRESCTVGVGRCMNSGFTMCRDLAVACDAEPREPEPELCNGADDDCDGETDEGFDVGGACTVGVGACQKSGQLFCSNGAAMCSAYALQPGIEVCNDIDDDCDGVVDDGNVCPGDVVQNTKPFNGGVWYTASTGQCGDERVLQFWPELNEDTFYSEFPCYSAQWQFRPTDGALFVYDSQGSGAVVRHHQGEDWEIVETPGCSPNFSYYFDGQDQLHYICQAFTTTKELRRGATGELVRSDVEQFYQVTADGRMLVRLASQLTLLDADGDIIDVYDPSAGFSGSMTLLDQRVTVSGNDLILLYTRRVLSTTWELVMFRIDENSELRLVRRLHLGATEPRANLLPISDGSIFEYLPDPDATSSDMIRRYQPDGTVSVVWRESETTFTTHGRDQLLIGPRL